MVGRYGHDPFDREDSPPPLGWKPRVRIKTDDAAEAISQRKPKQSRSRTSYEYHGDLKAHIKQLVLQDERMPFRELAALVARTGEHVSNITLSYIRTDFLHTLQHLRAHGKLRE